MRIINLLRMVYQRFIMKKRDPLNWMIEEKK